VIMVSAPIRRVIKNIKPAPEKKRGIIIFITSAKLENLAAGFTFGSLIST